MMGDTGKVAEADRTLLGRCLAGEVDATREFQQTYGDLVYSYPIRVYRMPPESAGDFYVFAFDKGRVFRRAQTFEGRTSLRAYLAAFVLDNLVLEWKRGDREVETVPIETLGELPVAETCHAPDEAETASMNDLLACVDVSKAALLKLLYIEDCELATPEIRCLVQLSGRRLPDLLAVIDAMRERIRERERRLRHSEDALEGAHAWIQLYERRLRRIAEDLANVPPTSTAAERLRAEREELERKVRRRQRQRTALQARTHRHKVTAPYKDIAALLNTTVGNVASQISRARKELAAKLPLKSRQAAFGEHDE